MKISMPILKNTVTEFTQAVRQHKAVYLDNEGNWEIESRLLDTIREHLGLDQLRRVALVRGFIKQLDGVERIPVNFDSGQSQEIDFQGYIEAGDALLETLKTATTKKARRAKKDLKRRLVGLAYRLESANSGLDPCPVSLMDLKQLVEIARHWKGKQEAFDHKGLTDLEIEQLKKTTQYPEFTSLLIGDKSLSETFMAWALLDGNPIEAFIEFPSIQRWISASDLQSRIGRYGGALLKVTKRHNKKEITLPIDGVDVSLLDKDQVITFKGNYQLTLKEIFEVFKNKKYNVGNLEFFKQGITNWNAHQMGWYDANEEKFKTIDLHEVDWWEHLPHFETITIQEAERRFNKQIQQGQWVVSAHVTRGQRTLDYLGTHAFIQVGIPTDSGQLRIFDFGKYGINFPRHDLEAVKMLTEMMPAVIAYPDDNVFYSKRQHGFYPFVIDVDRGREIMECIRQDMIVGLEGNLVYQIQSENCAKWTVQIFHRVLGEGISPDLYQMPLLETTPNSPIQKIFNLIKNVPNRYQDWLLTRLHYPLGAWRGIWIKENLQSSWKSLSNVEFFETGDVFLPALLLEKLEKKYFEHHIVDRYLNKTTWEQMLYVAQSACQLFQRVCEIIRKIYQELFYLEPSTLEILRRGKEKSLLKKLLEYKRAEWIRHEQSFGSLRPVCLQPLDSG